MALNNNNLQDPFMPKETRGLPEKRPGGRGSLMNPLVSEGGNDNPLLQAEQIRSSPGRGLGEAFNIPGETSGGFGSSLATSPIGRLGQGNELEEFMQFLLGEI